jgi:hypothetical protein
MATRSTPGTRSVHSGLPAHGIGAPRLRLRVLFHSGFDRKLAEGEEAEGAPELRLRSRQREAVLIWRESIIAIAGRLDRSSPPGWHAYDSSSPMESGRSSTHLGIPGRCTATDREPPRPDQGART